MIVCFERQLNTEWYRISRCIRDLANRGLGGIKLWDFLDFVCSHRTPLFILLFPLMKYKFLRKICDNDQEYYYQQQIRERLSGRKMPVCRSKGQLLVTLMAEMRTLKEDLINRKTGDERTKSIIPDAGSGEVKGIGHRLSFAFSAAMQQSKASNVSSTPPSAVQASSGSDSQPDPSQQKSQQEQQQQPPSTRPMRYVCVSQTLACHSRLMSMSSL